MRALRRLGVAAYALVIAAAVLFFCSKSSPGYPINDWTDANIYFTIGKAMTQGQVVYRDLYDHKGPLLYALHALCAWARFSDFTAVWVMEAVFQAAYLVAAYRLMRLWGARRAAWAALPVLAVLVCSSYSFQQGDSAEELCLPLLVWPVVWLMELIESGEERMPARRLVLSGVLGGCVLWIKFTLLGMVAGWLIALALRPAPGRRLRALGRAAGWYALGGALATLPWILYFGLNGALGDWLKTYLYDNLFLYGAAQGGGLAGRLKEMAVSAASWLGENLRYAPLLLMALGWSLRRGARERAAAWLMAGLGALGVFAGGKSYPYYGLALAALCPLGLAPVMIWLEKHVPRGWEAALAAVCATASVALCPLVSHNMTADYGASFGQPREETMQYRIAAHLEPGASLLNYGFMDAGFYTAAQLVPQVKYFHQTNVPLDVMLSEQKRYIDEAVCDYVVSRGNHPASLTERYELVATAPSPNFWYDEVSLYRRMEP